MQGSTHIKAELEQAKVNLEAAHRSGNLEKWRRFNTALFPNWKSS